MMQINSSFDLIATAGSIYYRWGEVDSRAQTRDPASTLGSPHLPSGLPLPSENVYLYTCQEPFLTACSRNADLHHPAFAFVTRDFTVLTWFHLCLSKVVLGGSDSGTFVAFTGQSVEKVNI